MTALTRAQQAALTALVNATLEAIGAAGESGAPSGVLYAGLMAQGCRLAQFQSLMSALEQAGKVRHDRQAHLYFLAAQSPQKGHTNGR